MSNETKVKTETVACDHNTQTVTFKHKAGPAGDQKNWPVVGELQIHLGKIPASLLCNDGSVTSLEAYGARALLMDRASDFRKFGAVEYMKEMERVYNEVLLAGRFDAERKASGPRLDSYLIQAVAKVKNLDYAVAQSAVSKLNPDQLVALGKSLAGVITELKAAAATVDDNLLMDLLEM